MGAYFSRSSAEVQEVDISNSSSYRFPPKTGNFFSSHFVMGGQKFETTQPEAYLFGENTDLNFLGPKPYNAAYKVSSPRQPVKALRCFVNIRKDSLRLVKVPRSLNKNVKNGEQGEEPDRQITNEGGEGPFLYNIEFTFDADTPCSATIYYNATEEMVNKNVIYSPEPTRDCSDTVHFSPGCNQQFCLPSHCIDPSKLATTDIDWTKGYSKIPIVIQICADCGPTVIGHSHITYAEFYKPTDDSWSIRTVKQKQAIDGVCYLIQEIFGIENKNAAKEEGEGDEDSEDDSSECVVCLSEPRDTLILPCKHLCLCSTCANQLRYQQSGCPICRQSFRALLQIRAVRKKTGDSPSSSNSRRRNEDVDSEGEEDEVEVLVPVPEGYEEIPLIEAIKGNMSPSSSEEIVPDSNVPSTSVDELSVVDETAQTSSSASKHIVTTTATADTSDSDDATDVSPVPCIVYENSQPACDYADENGTDDEVHMHEEINLPVGQVESEGTETGESQNSTKELLQSDRGDATEEQSTNMEKDCQETTSVVHV